MILLLQLLLLLIMTLVIITINMIMLIMCLSDKRGLKLSMDRCNLFHLETDIVTICRSTIHSNGTLDRHSPELHFVKTLFYNYGDLIFWLFCLLISQQRLAQLLPILIQFFSFLTLSVNHLTRTTPENKKTANQLQFLFKAGQILLK